MDVVPTVEVSFEQHPSVPSATSTPLTKTSEVILEGSEDEVDLVVNKNFINSAVTGNRYWTNQALQNDNSQKINQVQDVRVSHQSCLS